MPHHPHYSLDKIVLETDLVCLTDARFGPLNHSRPFKNFCFQSQLFQKIQITVPMGDFALRREFFVLDTHFSKGFRCCLKMRLTHSGCKLQIRSNQPFDFELYSIIQFKISLSLSYAYFYAFLRVLLICFWGVRRMAEQFNYAGPYELAGRRSHVWSSVIMQKFDATSTRSKSTRLNSSHRCLSRMPSSA